MKKLSWILYLAGVIGALVIGLLEGLGMMPTWTWVPIVLVVLGLLIGILNISNSEAVKMMIAALAIGLGAGVLTVIPMIGGVLDSILSKIAMISIPIAIPAAVRTIMRVAK